MNVCIAIHPTVDQAVIKDIFWGNQKVWIKFGGDTGDQSHWGSSSGEHERLHQVLLNHMADHD